MGLFRLFWIPEGSEAADGTYVRYPWADLLDILALESVRAGAFVVGEDLGTVEEFTRAELFRRRVLSYRLLWFEADGPDSGRWPHQALAAVTTHDLPTVAGLWTGRDLEAQRALGLHPNEGATIDIAKKLADWTGVDPDADVETVIERTYDLLGRSPTAVVTATLDDALAVRGAPQPAGHDRRVAELEPGPAPALGGDRDVAAGRGRSAPPSIGVIALGSTAERHGPAIGWGHGPSGHAARGPDAGQTDAASCPSATTSTSPSGTGSAASCSETATRWSWAAATNARSPGTSPMSWSAVLAGLPERCVVDGEIVIATPSGLDFDGLQQRIHPAASRVNMLAARTPASFVAFDLLALGTLDLRAEAFSHRRRALAGALQHSPPPTYLTPATTDRGSGR